MKTRNKKRLSIIVASFLAVLLIGTAFAFVMSQELRFNARVNVNAEMMVVFETLQTPAGGNQVGIVDWEVEFYHHIQTPYYAKTANIVVNFMADGTVTIPFTIKNIGTVAAETTNIAPILVNNPLAPYLTWSNSGFVSTVLQPGDTYSGQWTFTLDTTAVNASYLIGYAEFEFEIEYARP